MPFYRQWYNMECIGHMQIYFLILRQCLQRSVFAETVDDVFCSSLCDAGDVQIKFLHSAVVLQSIPQLQTPLRTQVVAAHTVHRSRKHILCVLLISKNVKGSWGKAFFVAIRNTIYTNLTLLTRSVIIL